MIKNIRFANLREDNDYLQKDVASILKVKEDTYSKWERCINDIPLQKSNQLALLYSVSLDYLLGLSNNNDIKQLSKNINYQKLFNRLKKLRVQHGYSQRQLGNKLGFSQTTYSNYERGFRKITTQKLMLISQFYNVSLDYLVGKSDNIKFL